MVFFYIVGIILMFMSIWGIVFNKHVPQYPNPLLLSVGFFFLYGLGLFFIGDYFADTSKNFADFIGFCLGLLSCIGGGYFAVGGWLASVGESGQTESVPAKQVIPYNPYPDEVLAQIIAFSDAVYSNDFLKNYMHDLDAVTVQFCDVNGNLDSDYMYALRIGVSLTDMGRQKYYHYNLRSSLSLGDLAKFSELQIEFAYDDAPSQSRTSIGPVAPEDRYPWVYIVQALPPSVTGSFPHMGHVNYTESRRQKCYDQLGKILESKYGDRYRFTPGPWGLRVTQ